MTTFGEVFRSVLEKMGLTQAQAADLLETSQSVISYYCHLEKPPRRRTIGMMSQRLGVSVEELTGQKPLRMAGRPAARPRPAPQVEAMEGLRARWRKKPQDRDTIRHLVAALFPANCEAVLDWLEGK